MAEQNEEIDIPWYQKVIALGAVVLIAVIIFIIAGAIFGQPSQQEATDRTIQNCGGGRFSSDTDCPEPYYDSNLYNEVNKHPDDSY